MLMFACRGRRACIACKDAVPAGDGGRVVAAMDVTGAEGLKGATHKASEGGYQAGRGPRAHHARD